jgi:TRAP transporter TAXI family solute receptor
LLASALVFPAWRACATQTVNPSWPSALLMATGRPGGVYDVYGPAWGRLAQQLSGVAVVYRASGGAEANILLIEQGAAELGMTTVTVANQARGGTGGWTDGVKLDGFRALFPMYPSVLQIVTPAKRGITALSGLAGRAIGIGPDGGSGAASVPAVLASLGIIPGQTPTADYAAQIRDMLAGRLDACAFIGAPPMPAILAAARTQTLGIIGFTPAEAAQVAAKVPGMTGMVIGQGTFPNQSAAIASVGTVNFAICAAMLPNALVNEITLAAMRNQAMLAGLVPAAATAPQQMLVAPGEMTFHPGAALALRSLGLAVPARLVEG